MRFYTVAFVGLVAAGLMMGGCGGSGGGSAPSGPAARVRLLNDYVDVSRVSGKIGSTKALISQPFATVSNYIEFPTSSQLITFTDASTSALLETRAAAITAGNDYTAIGLGSQAKGRNILFLTDATAANANQGTIRVLNGDEDAASVDVYITPTTAGNLTGFAPIESGIGFLEENVDYQTFSPGDVTIWVTVAGQPANVIVRNNETLTAGKVETFLAIKAASGPQIQDIPDGPSA